MFINTLKKINQQKLEIQQKIAIISEQLKLLKQNNLLIELEKKIVKQLKTDSKTLPALTYTDPEKLQISKTDIDKILEND